MKSYIVRVYPAAGSGIPHMVTVGVVEDPETGETQGFRDSAELWRIVSRRAGADPPDRPSRSDGRRGPNEESQ